MPILSIIVPVYNKSEYLDACIYSILDQTFYDFELILVNDGSTDGSAEQCDSLAAIDGRIIVIHQINSGVSSARNTGMNAAKGNYLGFVDADDTIQKDMYQLLVKNAIMTNADISICSLCITTDEKYVDNRQSETLVLTKEDTLANLISGKLDWSANNKIYKSTVVDTIRFEGSMNEDLWFCFNAVSKMKHESAFTDIQKYNYIKRENSVSLSAFNMKHLESIQVSNKILTAVSIGYPNQIDSAKTLDLISNLSILNLMILSKNQKNNDYQQVKKNLEKYKSSISYLQRLSKKQKYALKFFFFSPALYSFLFNIYCKIISTEAASKTL